MLAIIFQVQGARYAIRCHNVVEVIPRLTLRRVPQAPRWISGVFPYRGRLTPVVDLCELLAGYACPERLSSRVVLVNCETPEGGHAVTGFLAEHMTEARRIEASALPGTSLASGPQLGEMMLEEGGLLQVLDENAILAGAGESLAERLLKPRTMSGESDRETAQP